MRLACLVTATLAVTLGATADVPGPRASRAAHRASAPTTSQTARTATSPDRPPAGLSGEEWRGIRRSILESEYEVATFSEDRQGGTLHAANPRQRYSTTFRAQGIEMASAPDASSWRLGLSVTGYGHEGDVQPLPAVAPRAREDRVEYRRGPVTEWYFNRPDGLEQGFELDPPGPHHEGPLIIKMALTGGLQPSRPLRDTSGGGELVLADASGRTRVRYTRLAAWDRQQRPLRSSMRANVDGGIDLVVDARDAIFPVTVDPAFVHEAQLLGDSDPIGQAESHFGWSVSVSGDTAVVGAPFDDTGTDGGSAYVFTRTGTVWTEQQKLVLSDPAAGSFGLSVSVSGDTLVAGSRYETPPQAEKGAAWVFVRSGTVWTQQQKLLASDGAVNDSFGAAVAISGDTVIVGNPRGDTVAGLDSGSAYVFARSGTMWAEQQVLFPAGGASFDLFGTAVAVSGDTVVVGTPQQEVGPAQDAGSAYVFVRSGTSWPLQQRLVAADAAAGDTFGASCAIEGDTVVVGATMDDTAGGINAGSAYVFTRSGTTWTEQQKLLAANGLGFDYFGSAVSISGDTAAIGAPVSAGFAGSVYVFVRSGTVWAQQQEVMDPDNGSNKFGLAAALSGDTLVAGAPERNTLGGNDAGMVHVYVRSGTAWTAQQQMVSRDGAHDEFGASLSLSGNTLVVGAPSDTNLGGLEAGSAYVFVRSGAAWVQQARLRASDAAPQDHFGIAVAVAGDTVVVGAPGDDTPGGMDTGSAYVFVRSGTTWTEQQKLAGVGAVADENLGSAVAVSADTAVIGGPAYGVTTPGAVYVFVRSGTIWSQQQRLLASNGMLGDHFGAAVSIAGDTLVAGAPDTGLQEGTAYVFVRSGTAWSEQQALMASDTDDLSRFAAAVAVSSDTVVVGAFRHAPAGAAYAFVRSGTVWTEQQKLLPSDGQIYDEFGSSVALLGDRALVGAAHAGAAHTGAAYLFRRTGAAWTQQQRLLASDPAENDDFGGSAALSTDTAAIGAPGDDTLENRDTGSANVYREMLVSDVAATKTDGQSTAVPGQPLTYTIVVSNAGPDAVSAAAVADPLPAALQGPSWTCVASAGSTCAPSGAGNISDVVSLAAGGAATYVVTGTLAPAATGTLTNTVTVAVPSGTHDPSPANNAATDIDILTPETDLSLTKTDSADPVAPGDPFVYTLAARSNGPSNATGVNLTDVLPGGVSFVSSVPGPPTCTPGGGILTCALGPMNAGATASVTVNVTVNAGASGILVNTATITGAEADPDTTNNTASAATAVGIRDGELAHGSEAVYDLASLPGPAPDEDVFRIEQKPLSSYEVVVDATSGDIAAGSGPSVERLAPDGTSVLQASAPIGTGSSRSLRWRNSTALVVEGETIRVRSAGCSTDCGADDIYRIRVYETTYSVPRFNNAGTQVTVLVLHNPASYAISGDAYFRASSGSLAAVASFTLAPKATLVVNSASLPGAGGVSGAVTVAHDGRYGDLVGKTVALEPATGFSFDSPMVPRPK